MRSCIEDGTTASVQAIDHRIACMLSVSQSTVDSVQQLISTDGRALIRAHHRVQLSGLTVRNEVLSCLVLEGVILCIVHLGLFCATLTTSSYSVVIFYRAGWMNCLQALSHARHSSNIRVPALVDPKYAAVRSTTAPNYWLSACSRYHSNEELTMTTLGGSSMVRCWDPIRDGA